MLQELEGDAEDDTYDIPIEEIRASRTRKELPVALRYYDFKRNEPVSLSDFRGAL